MRQKLKELNQEVQFDASPHEVEELHDAALASHEMSQSNKLMKEIKFPVKPPSFMNNLSIFTNMRLLDGASFINNISISDDQIIKIFQLFSSFV